jgi:hypothetical protein
VEGGEGGGAGERRAAAEGGAEGRAEGPEVGGRSLGPAGDPLGGHVVRGADEHAGHGEGLGVLDGGDAEVGEDGVVGARALDEDVGRFDVAVQDALRVYLAEGVDEFEADPSGVPHAEGAVLRHDLLQGAAVDQFHDDPQPVARVDDVVDAHDMGMVDTGRGPGLPQGSLAPGAAVLRVETVDTHFLDGDLSVEHLVGGPPDPAHSPLADAGDQAISACHHKTRNTTPPCFRHPPDPLQQLTVMHQQKQKVAHWSHFAPHQHSADKSCGTSS